MSKYLITYLALMFFATSLAVADDPMHVEGSKTTREPAVEGVAREQNVEVETSAALPLIQALEDAEKGLGKRRSTGEVSDVIQE